MAYANIAKIGLGVLGGFAAMKIAEAYDEEIEFKEQKMIQNLSMEIKKDGNNTTDPITAYTLN